MSIPNKQIGWSNESNLLWQIAKQLERLTGVTSKISGGSATVVTKAEMDALIASNSLVPGSTYIITGVDVPLYGGTTIMLQAETTNKLTLAGHGVFYNPKYQNSQLTPFNGYGVWSNYMYPTLSNIVGDFIGYANGSFLETVTADNGATALYLANGYLQWISGNWSAATSIIGNTSGATANISGAVSPSYAIGQDVIWGGKHWTNTSGNVGTAVDKYTLSGADWTEVVFNDIDYNVSIDIIHYDYEHDMIIRRKDKWGNDVDGSYQIFIEYSDPNGYGYGNPIKDFQWGNGPDDFNTDDYYYLGVVGNYVKDSYLECINFIGGFIYENNLTGQSRIIENVIVLSGYIAANTLIGGTIGSNIVGGGLGSCEITNGNSGISRNEILGQLTYNSISSSAMTNCIINVNNYMSNNVVNGSLIICKLYDNCFISSNIMNGGNLQCTLNDYSNIQYNQLQDSTIFVKCNGNSEIKSNILKNSTLDFTPSGIPLSSKVIANIEANYAQGNVDISTATIIYGNYSKQMFRNSAGVTKLGYYNASDVFTVVNVNA